MKRVPRRYATRLSDCNNGQISTQFLRQKKGSAPLQFRGSAALLRPTMTNSAAIERAYELARSGQYRSVSEILRRLQAADRPIVEAHLLEPNARRQLILVCGEAWLATQ